MNIIAIKKVKTFSESWRYQAIMKQAFKLALQVEVSKTGKITIPAENFKFDPIKKIQ